MVKILSRDAINRMVGRKSSVAGVGGGGGDVDLSGYATKIWTQETFVSIDFFRSLFRAYDSQNHEILPNDTTSTIDNIKAMFGFWTDFYISALGTGGHQSVDLRLAQLADVNVAGVTNGQVLTYDTTSGKWIASTPQSGTDMATVWANLAASGNQQIDASHLTTALNGYATQTWVTNQGYITASAISDMATQTWVGQNYLSKNDAAETYLSKTAAANTYLSIAFFNRLFKAYNGTTQVNPNDTAAAIDNIKAMFGFWTDFYISALGTGGHQSVDLRLAQLADVNVAGVTNDQVLTYDSTTGKWIASTPQAGTDMATVWANLAANGNQQINASHLTTALTGYATQTWVGQQGYITSSGNAASATKLKNARTIWGQSFDGTANVSGNLSGATTITASSDITTSGDLNGNGGVVKIEKQSGEPQLRFHTPGVAWGNIRLNSSSQFCFYQAYESSSYAALNTGSLGVHGYIAITNGQRIHQTEESGSILYIGSSNNYGWVRIQDVCSQNGNAGDDYWSIRASGAAVFTSVYSKTYVTALSDARHKDVIGDTGLTVEDIAKAPAIRFQWNDRDDKTVFAGSIAQYWQNVLPEVVQSQADDTLSLDYQVAALISSITVARKVMNHESRLQRLEKMFAINEDDIED